MGRFIQKVSCAYVVSSKQMRVKFLAINFERARWLHEVMCVVLCCGLRGRRGELCGLWYYFCTETIGRKCILLTSPRGRELGGRELAVLDGMQDAPCCIDSGEWVNSDGQDEMLDSGGGEGKLVLWVLSLMDTTVLGPLIMSGLGHQTA